jgi:calnexin
MILLIAQALAASRPKRLRDPTGLPYLPDCEIIYFENFSDPHVFKRWIPTQNPRYTGKWKTDTLFQLHGRRGEKGLIIEGRAESQAISHTFRHPISVSNETLVIQYEARAQFVFTCSQGFMTIFTNSDFDPTTFGNESVKFIEFGPERCYSFNQSRFNVYTIDSENQLVQHSIKRSHWIPVDEVTHLYTLIVRPNGTFETLIDNRSSRNGTWTDDFTPPLFENPTINDPTDVKPSDWVDDVIIRDPAARKPKDWDDDAPFKIPDPAKRTPPPGWLLNEPKTIPDASAKRPANWDADTMGEWTPPSVPNPRCIRAPGCGPYKAPKIRNLKARGKWRAPYISNPNYKGEWKPRQIPNPNYTGVKPEFVMPPIIAIGFNVWSEYRDFAFTNILIATDEAAVRLWNAQDHNVRHRRQVRKMKINYDWVRIDVPDDWPEPGITGHVEYWGRCTRRAWQAIPNKPVVIGITTAVLCLIVPIVIMCYTLCEPDPFTKIKDD